MKRFWDKVDVKSEDECWEWTAARGTHGYGVFLLVTSGKKKTVTAHRFAMELAGVEIPKGMLVCHHCDNRGCVNPAHLYVGTHTDNLRDAVVRERRPEFRPDNEGDKNPNAKLTGPQVRVIKEWLTYPWFTHKNIATAFKVSESTISEISRGKIWANA